MTNFRLSSTPARVKCARISSTSLFRIGWQRPVGCLDQHSEQPRRSQPFIHARYARDRRRSRAACPQAKLQTFQSDDVAIERSLGIMGLMSVTNYNPAAGAGGPDGGLGMDLDSIQQLSSQVVDQDVLEVRLYSGRVVRGALSGARIILKAYPPPALAASIAAAAAASAADGAAAPPLDVARLADNEVRAQLRLQEPAVAAESDHVAKLLGTLTVAEGAAKGERWLLFHNAGATSAAEYAERAAQATVDGKAVGEGEFWDQFDGGAPLKRRKLFIVKLLRQVFTGLAFMHAAGRLHQSLGPASVLLSTAEERDVTVLRARLADLAFSADVSDEALVGGATIGDLWDRGGVGGAGGPSKGDFSEQLWRRARQAGAYEGPERREFGIADDMQQAGLLTAFLAFVPLCPPGSIDGPAIQRLFEVTFRLDFAAIREYVEADEAWDRAAEFLAAADGAGWDFLEGCMKPEWRTRLTPEAALKHPFLQGAAVM
eukprot:jgi/Ulvmu1/6782/UM030_0120.1